MTQETPKTNEQTEVKDRGCVSLKLYREENGSVTFEVNSTTEDFELNCAIRGIVELFPEIAQQCYEKGMEIFAEQLDEARVEIKRDGDLTKMPVLGQA